jgi:hypothetical protein
MFSKFRGAYEVGIALHKRCYDSMMSLVSHTSREYGQIRPLRRVYVNRLLEKLMRDVLEKRSWPGGGHMRLQLQRCRAAAPIRDSDRAAYHLAFRCRQHKLARDSCAAKLPRCAIVDPPRAMHLRWLTHQTISHQHAIHARHRALQQPTPISAVQLRRQPHHGSSHPASATSRIEPDSVSRITHRARRPQPHHASSQTASTASRIEPDDVNRITHRARRRQPHHVLSQTASAASRVEPDGISRITC